MGWSVVVWTAAALVAITDNRYSEELEIRLKDYGTADVVEISKLRNKAGGVPAESGHTTLIESVASIEVASVFSNLPFEMFTQEPLQKANYAPAGQLIYERRYHIVPPTGFQPAPLPASSETDLGPGNFQQSYSMNADGSVSAVLKFDIVQRPFTPSEYEEFHDKFNKLVRRGPIKIKFDLTAHQLFTQGQLKESLQAYRGLVNQHPHAVTQQVRRADALLRAGMGEAARDAAAAAIKIDPKSALAHKTQAHILQHDLLGRLHEKGADYGGAAAAYRQAIALDPDDKQLVVDYATLLEHDTEGKRYGAGADLKGAIEQYRSLSRQQIVQLGIGNNLPYAVFYSGDYEFAQTLANRVVPPSLELLVACDAQLKGAAHALDQARSRAENETKYKEVVTSAADMLLHRREYRNAAALFEAGASGAETAKKLAMASILRELQPHETIQYGQTPESVMRRNIVAFVRNPESLLSTNPFESHNAQRAREGLTLEERDEVLRKLKNNLMMESELPAEAKIDLVLRLMQVRSTAGDDDVGYRLTLTVLDSPPMPVLIVKEKGEYRALNGIGGLTAVAYEVLERLEKRNFTSASTLLTWTRESQSYRDDDDPYGSDPYGRFWPIEQRPVEARDITLAAAALLVQSKSSAPEGIALLEEAKTSASADELERIDHALIVGYEEIQDHEHALAAAIALGNRPTQSKRLFGSHSLHLRALGRFTEADTLAQRRLQKTPGDIDALRSFAANAAAQHDYAAAYERWTKITAHESAEASDFNSRAWVSLFFDRPGGPDIDSAVRAFQLKQDSAPILHTLASVYAAAGKTREAREVMFQAMALRSVRVPDDSYWYPFARIAEQYDEKETARAYYSKVKLPKDRALEYSSTYRLAQQRLQILRGR